MSRSPLLVRQATTRDLAAVLRLASQAALPELGIAEDIEDFLVAERDSRVIGSAGLTPYGDDALLRTVVVAQESRGGGAGRLLVEAALRRARGLEVRAIYLLTTTAQDFFGRLGFDVVSRQLAPSGVRESRQFKAGCPAAAVLMRLSVNSRSDVP